MDTTHNRQADQLVVSQGSGAEPEDLVACTHDGNAVQADAGQQQHAAVEVDGVDAPGQFAHGVAEIHSPVAWLTAQSGRVRTNRMSATAMFKR